jgi:hypothetical protein
LFQLGQNLGVGLVEDGGQLFESFLAALARHVVSWLGVGFGRGRYG